MCMAPKPAKLPPVPAVKDEEPVAPMQSPEDPEGGKSTTGALRKSRTGRRGLKIDLSGSGSGGTGLNIPV